MNEHHRQAVAALLRWGTASPSRNPDPESQNLESMSVDPLYGAPTCYRILRTVQARWKCDSSCRTSGRALEPLAGV